jgi:hypothetical protein
MENTTTTELLEVLRKMGTGAGDDYDEDVYDEAFAELKTRSPFWELFNEDWEEGIPQILVRLADLEEELKKLKRHKHDPVTGDVMVRI